MSPLHEIQPYLSKDARTVFFTRGAFQVNDIWMATRTSGRSNGDRDDDEGDDRRD